MINPWFKFYAQDYLSDLKILQLDAQERSCWITLLCLANQSEGGVVKLLSERQLLIISGVTDLTIEVLKKFVEMEMIQMSNGVVTVKNWEKRQYSEGYSRVKEHRKRKSNEYGNGKDNDRTEQKREEEKRIDKNIYGEFGNVKLTEIEHAKLLERFTERNTNILIAELDTGIESKGYKYKSHYATILNWASRKFKEHTEKKLSKGKAIV